MKTDISDLGSISDPPQDYPPTPDNRSQSEIQMSVFQAPNQPQPDCQANVVSIETTSTLALSKDIRIICSSVNIVVMFAFILNLSLNGLQGGIFFSLMPLVLIIPSLVKSFYIIWLFPLHSRLDGQIAPFDTQAAFALAFFANLMMIVPYSLWVVDSDNWGFAFFIVIQIISTIVAFYAHIMIGKPSQQPQHHPQHRPPTPKSVPFDRHDDIHIDVSPPEYPSDDNNHPYDENSIMCEMTLSHSLPQPQPYQQHQLYQPQQPYESLQPYQSQQLYEQHQQYSPETFTHPHDINSNDEDYTQPPSEPPQLLHPANSHIL